MEFLAFPIVPSREKKTQQMRMQKISALHLLLMIQIDGSHPFSWATPWGGGDTRIGHKPYDPP